MKKIQDLNGRWSLYIVPNKDVKKLGLIGKTESELKAAGLSPISGCVPGNFELDMMREGIGLRAYGQKNPLLEYKKEAYDLFNNMMFDIQSETVKHLFRTKFGIQVVSPEQMNIPQETIMMDKEENN